MNQPAFFSSQVSISVRMPKFQFLDHSDQEHWMSTAYASSLTHAEMFSTSAFSFEYTANEEPHPEVDVAHSKKIRK